jgi:hypothetical protein
MRRFILFSAAVLIAVALILELVATAAKPITSWQTFDRQFPAAAESAGLVVVGLKTEASDYISLPLALRVRQLLHPEPRPQFVTGFPDAVHNYTLESVHGRVLLHCLVRYSGDMVGRIVVRHPPGAKADALRLREALHQAFPGDRVSLHEAGVP